MVVFNLFDDYLIYVNHWVVVVNHFLNVILVVEIVVIEINDVYFFVIYLIVHFVIIIYIDWDFNIVLINNLLTIVRTRDVIDTVVNHFVDNFTNFFNLLLNLLKVLNTYLEFLVWYSLHNSIVE